MKIQRIIGWLGIFMGLLMLSSVASADATTQEVSIIAKSFQFYPNQIVVRANQPVRLYLTSVDVDHGIAISGYNINKAIKPGAVTTIDFIPNKKGVFDFHCSVFCGLGHMGMKGKLFVVE